MNKEIEQLINEFAEKRYQEGYDDGYKDGAKSGYITSYQEGLNDAWECARKLVHPNRGGMSDLKTEAYYWDGSRDAYAYVLNILKNFLKKVEKS